jgi:hypothetical protein
MITIRKPGAGKYIVSIRGKESPVTLLNMRNNERKVCSWEDIIKDIESFQRSIVGKDVYTAWELVYGEDIFPADTLEPSESQATELDVSVAPTMQAGMEKKEAEQEQEVKKPADAPAQKEAPKKKPLINEERQGEEMHVYTVQFRCSKDEYKKLQNWAYNNSIKLKKIGER